MLFASLVQAAQVHSRKPTNEPKWPMQTYLHSEKSAFLFLTIDKAKYT